MNKIELMNQARIEKALSKQYRFNGQVLTLKQYIELRLSEGATIFPVKLHDANAAKKIKERMDRIKRGDVIIARSPEEQKLHGSNHNLPKVKEYWKLFDELFDGCNKIEYWIGVNNETVQSGTKIPKIVAENFLKNYSEVNHE